MKQSEAIVRSAMRGLELPEEDMARMIQILENTKLLDGITEMDYLDKGMTNNLFFFISSGNRYLFRMPGEGTEKLVNRKSEEEVYHALKNKHVSDEIVYIHAQDGVKITKYLSNVHTCNPRNAKEVSACMKHLRRFHGMQIQVQDTFDVFRKIEEYEQQCDEYAIPYGDYYEVKEAVMSLERLIDSMEREECLCHIDPVYDNFLMRDQEVHLIDWEYAAMSDPHIDIAMFAIYADYSRVQTDELMSFYFGQEPSDEIKAKIYAYMSASAFLWVLWCEIKKKSDIYYDAYERTHYRLARSYYQFAGEYSRQHSLEECV